MILGKHAIMDLKNCRSEDLDNINLIKDILLRCCKKADLHVVETTFHKFEPIGISGIIVLAESHLAIHTWPEHNFASIDAFTCGSKMNPSLVLKLIAEELQSNDYFVKEINRGELFE